MDRAFSSGASGTPPSAPVSPSTGYATSGNPGTATPATKPGAWWYHMITEELRKLIVDAGLTPDYTNISQVSTAVQSLISQAKGNRRSYTIFNTNQTLGNTAFGGVYESSGSSSLTCQLPSAAANPGGSILVYNGQSAGTLTMSTAGGIFYGPNNPGGTSTVVMQFGTQMEFISDGTNWKVVNGTGLASLAGTGYQKLPSGLIIQWGNNVTNASGVATVTWPIAFPSACFIAVASPTNGGIGSLSALIGSQTVTNGNFYAQSAQSIGFMWIALGK